MRMGWVGGLQNGREFDVRRGAKEEGRIKMRRRTAGKGGGKLENIRQQRGKFVDESTGPRGKRSK